MSQDPPSTRVEDLTPLLFVSDIEASTAFYRDKLGFQIAETWKPNGKLAWCRLERGGAAVMLQQAGEEDGPAENRGCGVVFYFLCVDAEALYGELSDAGLQLQAPQVAFYGMNQLYLTDPDGYQLCFQNPTVPSSTTESE